MKRLGVLALAIAVGVAGVAVVLRDGGEGRSDPSPAQVERRLLEHPPALNARERPRSVTCHSAETPGYFDCVIWLGRKSQSRHVLGAPGYRVHIRTRGVPDAQGYDVTYQGPRG